MSQAAHKNFTCPHCHKRFQWTTKIADRKAQCPACAKRIRIPTVPGRVAEAVDPLPESHKPAQPQVEQDTYELDLTGIDESVAEAPPTPAQQAAAQTGRCPACNQSINPGAVICVKCGYNLKKGKRLQTDIANEDDAPKVPESLAGSALSSLGPSTVAQALANREDEAKASKIIDFYLPIAMIITGPLITLGGYMALSQHLPIDTDWWKMALVSYPIQLFLFTPALLLAATLTVSLLGASFGTLTQGILKFIAITTCPMALADVLVFVLVPAAMSLSILAAFGIYFMVYIVLCAPFFFLMFDLENVEVMLTVVATIILRTMVTISLGALYYTIF